MLLRNRVKDLYETAVEYMRLGVTEKMAIAMHFKTFGPTTLRILSQESLDRVLFRDIMMKDKVIEFKKYVTHFRRANGDDGPDAA